MGEHVSVNVGVAPKGGQKEPGTGRNHMVTIKMLQKMKVKKQQWAVTHLLAARLAASNTLTSTRINGLHFSKYMTRHQKDPCLGSSSPLLIIDTVAIRQIWAKERIKTVSQILSIVSTTVSSRKKKFCSIITMQVVSILFLYLNVSLDNLLVRIVQRTIWTRGVQALLLFPLKALNMYFIIMFIIVENNLPFFIFSVFHSSKCLLTQESLYMMAVEKWGWVESRRDCLNINSQRHIKWRKRCRVTSTPSYRFNAFLIPFALIGNNL